jgi:hypothetical protein
LEHYENGGYCISEVTVGSDSHDSCCVPVYKEEDIFGEDEEVDIIKWIM